MRDRERTAVCVSALVRLLLLTALALTLPPAHVRAEAVDLVILHMNDTHGKLRPFNTRDGQSIGGIARLATLAEQVRARNPGRTLLFHAGDVLSRGGPLTVHYGGIVNLKAMECAGYDAFTPGNGEFYFCPENLLKQVATVRFPTIMANLTRRDTGAPLFPSHVILERAGIKVGVLGLGFVRTNHHAAGDLVLADPVTAAKREVPALRPRVDLLIALTHIGHGADRRLAAYVPELDIIIGGHSHTALRKPVRIPRQTGEGEVVVVQAGGEGRFAGRLDIRMERQEGHFRVVAVEGALIPINAELPENKAVQRILDEYDAPLSVPVFRAGRDHTRDEMRLLLADAMREELHADVACLGKDTVRTGLTEGEHTLADLCLVHPWRNRILRVDVPADPLVALTSVDGLTVAGLQAEGSDNAVTWRVNGTPLAEGRTYSLLADEYIVHATPQLRALASTDTGERLDTLLTRHLRRTMPLVPQAQ